jgi:hypothetical protein
MALKLSFKIEEAADALSFVFTDTTGDYDAQLNPTGWGTPNIGHVNVVEANLLIRFQDGEVYSYPFDLVGGNLNYWTNGVEIFTYDVNFIGDTFTDGVYDFRLQVIDNFNEEHLSDALVMGFCAVITGKVMKESLSYKISDKRTYKEWVLEKMRLLDNLRYSAETGNLQHFQDNLSTLERIK